MSELGELYILGYSGHAYVVLDTAESMGLIPVGYFEKKEMHFNPYNLQFLGDERHFNFRSDVTFSFFFPAVGLAKVRKSMIKLIRQRSWQELALIHLSAVVSRSAKVCVSALVGPRAIVNSMAVVGEGSIINSGAIIEHECKVGPYSHIAPGAILAGNVTVGEESFIGGGSFIKEGIKIGSNVVIGAGAVVLKDISNNQTWVGNPAKRIK